jgi:hypothetical protein
MSRTRNEALARAARRQIGLFTLADALGAGFTRHQVRRRLASAEWSEVAPRVYRVAVSAPLRWDQATLALALATGGYAYGRSAAAIHGLGDPPLRPEVVVERRRRTAGNPAGVHSTDDLPREDRRVVGGVPVTSPARTVIDLARDLPLHAAEDVLDRAIVRRLTNFTILERRARELRSPSRGGCAVVLRLLAQRNPNMADVRNGWEAAVLRGLRQMGIAVPEPDHPVFVDGRRRYLDFAWPDKMVALEFDGFDPHSGRRVFDDDRERQNALVDAGWKIFRVTSTSLRQGPRRWTRPIARALL